MVGKLIQVEWGKTWRKAGWVFPPEITNKNTFFSKWNLWRIPRNLWKYNIRQRFDNTVSGTEFLNVWLEICGGLDPQAQFDKILALNFKEGNWDIPWELLVEKLEHSNNRATVCLVRTVDKVETVALSIIEEPLRILVFKGAPSRPGLDELDLNKEVTLILDAWHSLEASVKQCISEPIAVDALQKDFVDQLNTHNPNLIWFTGHGEAEPQAQLLFADNTWVNAEELAALIRKSRAHPLYAVFSACDTARAAKKRDPRIYPPELFGALAKVNILSMLAMQAPVSEPGALFLTGDLLRYLSVGFPLEKAVARIRSQLLEAPPEKNFYLDWAIPVVWSAGIPVDNLQWNISAGKMAQYQVLGRNILGWGQQRPQQLYSTIKADEIQRATEWVSNQHTWIHGHIGEAEHRLYWIRTLRALQAHMDLFVLTIELDSEDAEGSLLAWAHNVYGRMLPGDFPEEIAQKLEKITRRPQQGWSELCSIEGLYLAIANPSPLDTDWFWNPLLSESHPKRICILTEQEITEEVYNSWAVTGIGRNMEREAIEKAVEAAPRLAKALAVLNLPLGPSYLTIEPGEGASSVQEWEARDSVLLDTAAGPLMTAQARQYVLSKIASETALEEAHLYCVKILGHSELNLTPAIRERRLEHLLGAKENEEAVNEADILCHIYREGNQPSLVLKVVERLGSLSTSLPGDTLLIVAWANLQLGLILEAQFYLDRSIPSRKEPLDMAWKHGIQHEIYKSSGEEHSKEKALEEIEEAIRICEEAEKENPDNLIIQKRKLAYLQDRARIKQFLFYKLKSAKDDYQSLVEAWSDLPNNEFDLAIVKRNYAECLIDLSRNHDANYLQRAKDLLHDAEDYARKFPYAIVLPEILYEKAKIVEQEISIEESNEVLRECIETALARRHYMLVAIARNRLFWNEMEFQLSKWKKIEADLEGFPNHGWAVRTLIDSRLHMAHILKAKGNLSAAFTQLEANRTNLAQNPSFDQGSDRVRIARTFAGLQIVGQELSKGVYYWQEFSQYPWAQKWLSDHLSQQPEDIWAEVKY